MSFNSNGVTLTSQFNLKSKEPLDGRYVITNQTELANLLELALYPGLEFMLTKEVTHKSRTYKIGVYKAGIDSNGNTSEDLVVRIAGPDGKLSGEHSVEIKGDATGSANFSGGKATITVDVNHAAALDSKSVGTKTGAPVFFNADGKPEAMTALSLNTTGSAAKLTTGRKITLDGDATGEITFDGSENKTLTVTVVDDSHNHIIDNVDGLSDTLDSLETAISDEETARENADTQLQTALEAEITRSTTKDNELSRAVANATANTGNVTTPIYFEGGVPKASNLIKNITGQYATKSVGGITGSTSTPVSIQATTLEDLLKTILGIQGSVAPSGFSITSPSSVNVAMGATSASVTPNWSVSKGTYTSESMTITINGKSTTSTASSGSVGASSVSVSATANSVSISGTAVGATSKVNLSATKSISVKRDTYSGAGTVGTAVYRTKSELQSGVTLNFTLSGNQAIFKYPSYWGDLTTIYNSTGENIATFTKTTSGSFNIYTLSTASTGNVSYTFKI